MPTHIFDAVDELYDILSVAVPATAGLEDVVVVDGGPLRDVMPWQLHVGYEQRQGVAADGDQRNTGWDAAVRMEDFDVTLTCYGGSGDPSTRATRQKLRDVYRAVEAAVSADPKLNGSVEQAQVGGRVVLNQQQTSAGAWVALQFTVVCIAYP